MQAEVNMSAIWEKVVNQVKLKVIHPTLWRSLELVVPIIIENDQFVVGLAPGNFHLSGHLTGSEHQNAIESALREFAGKSLSLRIIEGTTIQDWMQVKAKDQSMQAMKEAAYRKREVEIAAAKSWEGLLETVGRRYAALHLRQLPQFRAKYIEEMLATISDTMDVLMPEGSPKDELAERSLARVIEKVGTLAEVPPAMIALELRRFRGK